MQTSHVLYNIRNHTYSVEDPLSAFKIGQPVRVRRTNHQPGYEDGVISGKNTSDSTFDIEYNNGKIERFVDPKRVRAKVQVYSVSYHKICSNVFLIIDISILN